MILVTGANGFLGRAICDRIRAENKPLRAVTRELRGGTELHNPDLSLAVGCGGGQTDWATALVGLGSVVHLAPQDAATGMRRFVFLSSIKVNGESTELGRPFFSDDTPLPQDPYAVSKLEAEEGLKRIAKETRMEFVILRPPLVFGSGVKANFNLMMKCVAEGLPLPLAAVTNNRRSLVGLDNLVGLMLTCLSDCGAVNQTFLVSDGEDLSSTDLLVRIGAAMGKSPWLFSMPTVWLRMGAILLNRSDIYHRLFGYLQIDMSKTLELLQWPPPLSVDDGLRRMFYGGPL